MPAVEPVTRAISPASRVMARMLTRVSDSRRAARGLGHRRRSLVRHHLRHHVRVVRGPAAGLAAHAHLHRDRRRRRWAGRERLGALRAPVHALRVQRCAARQRTVPRRRALDGAAQLHVHGVLRVCQRALARIGPAAHQSRASVARMVVGLDARGVGVVDPRSRLTARQRVLPRRGVPLSRTWLLVRVADRKPARLRTHRRDLARGSVPDGPCCARPTRRRPASASAPDRAAHLPRSGVPSRRGRVLGRCRHHRRRGDPDLGARRVHHGGLLELAARPRAGQRVTKAGRTDLDGSTPQPVVAEDARARVPAGRGEPPPSA